MYRYTSFAFITASYFLRDTKWNIYKTSRNIKKTKENINGEKTGRQVTWVRSKFCLSLVRRKKCEAIYIKTKHWKKVVEIYY